MTIAIAGTKAATVRRATEKPLSETTRGKAFLEAGQSHQKMHEHYSQLGPVFFLQTFLTY